MMPAKVTESAALKSKIVSLLDFTLLDDTTSVVEMAAFCQRAITPLGLVAAVCIPLNFISIAQQELHESNIAIATVINFPDGNQALPDVLTAIALAISAGAAEIDVVIPYHCYLTNDDVQVSQFLQHIRKACPATIKLKIILETGALKTADLIARASKAALNAGADFIKTSTGKIAVGATLEAAEIMLKSIKKYAPAHGGFKAAGNIRTLAQAQQYLSLAEAIMGSDWISSKTFRFGASSLLNDLLQDDAVTRHESY